MNKIKIAYLIDSLKRAGAQKLLLDICKNINKDKFEVFIITLKGGLFFEEFKNIKGIKIIELRNKSKKIDSNFLFKIPLFCKQYKELCQIVKKEKFDIIHSHLFFPDIYNGLLKRKYRYIAITTKHDTNFYRKRRYLWIGKTFDSRMDYVTTCSKSVKDILGRYSFIHNLRVIYNAIDLEKIVHAKSSSQLVNKKCFNIISVGRLTEQKGFDHLIQSFKRFNNQVEESNLFICGEGEKRKQLENLIKQLRLEGKVHLLGERNDVYALIKSSDLFVLLSNWEGFGIVVLEAMACRVPVIGSNVDGIREIIGNDENGYLVNRFDYNRVAQLMMKIKENKKMTRVFKDNGFNTVNNKFNIKKNIKEYERLYLDSMRDKHE